MLKSTNISETNKVALATGFLGTILLWLLAVWLLVAFATYSSSDPGMSWSSTSSDTVVNNLGGRVGALVADVGISAFGFTTFLIPFAIALAGWNWLRSLTRNVTIRSYAFVIFILGLILALIGGSGLENLYGAYQTQYHHGGIAGYETADFLVNLIGAQYSALVLLVIFAIGSTTCKLIPWLTVFEFTGRSIFRSVGLGAGTAKSAPATTQKQTERSRSGFRLMPSFGRSKTKDVQEQKPEKRKTKATQAKRTITKATKRKEPYIVPLDVAKNTKQATTSKSQEQAKTTSPGPMPPRPKLRQEEVALVVPRDDFPDTSILDPSETSQYAYSEEEIFEMGERIQTMLSEFNVEVAVKNANPGPVITQFEIEPAAGVKANQVVNLANDLARTLTVQSVRVVDNIPGTSHVGLEIPNKYRETVRLVDGLESESYRSSEHPLTIVLGKDISGKTVITNLAAMPHLLIAGTTGAGKSVCLNAILLSFLFKSSPDQLRLLMVDPKMLEFSIYEGIPHLMAPVITDMNKTHNALHWCISEMERRFAVMAGLGVRNMENYNEHLANARTPVLDPTASDPLQAEPLKPFPYIVFVIDELSDLIMVMGKKAEELIIRIAQRARAAGIHLIVATQRPSTDVIRGVLKANIPTRIAFRVASNADSRTILDQTGAEHLLGKGDMLFIPPGSSLAKRVHGAFVSDDEVKRVVDHLKKSHEPTYDEGVEQALSGDTTLGDADSDGSNEVDELYEQALDVVSRSKTTSISKIQRELRIGYNRAARIIEAMESDGVVSPPQSGGTRSVLLTTPEG